MGKINVLDFEIANLIAAGEVVERPSSVMKELIENSIDAGATKIVAEIKRGGTSLIRVTDNGCGIDKEDLPVALMRHATSKIRSKDDLDGILTLGFRGEALAAISSVSNVKIITRTKESDVAYFLTADAGSVVDVCEVSATYGTTVVVEDLFYNVPARRKFLKKDSTEAMNVAAIVEKVALCRPDISIQLLIDGEEKFKTYGDNNLYNTVRCILGKEFASKLISVDGDSDGVKVFGFIGRSDNVRKNRNLQNVFINKRYVKSLTVGAALEKAYTSYIAPECFPACVLFVDINPAFVDVNVHPSKLEVKFSDERRIFEAVYYTVRSALENEEYRPIMTLKDKSREYNPLGAFVPLGESTKGEQIKFSQSSFNKPSSFDTKKWQPATFKSDDLDKPLKIASGKGSYRTGATVSSTEELFPRKSLEILDSYKKAENIYETFDNKDVPEYKYIGEAFNCYLIIEKDGELLIIDKHAAHERILFEDFKKKREQDGRVSSQRLLMPITVILSPVEISAVNDFSDEFSALGFEFSLYEKHVDILAIPDAISIGDAEGLFVKLASETADGVGTPENSDKIRREKMLYQIACKAAVKGGRIYDSSITDWIIKKVLQIPDITVCPHGRPIAYKLKKSELDRQFERIK